MIRIIFTVLICLSLIRPGNAQTRSVSIDADNQPLNLVLLQLRDTYHLQLSYNDAELSKYKVTVSKTFQDGESALKYLIKDFPLKLKISGEVLIIIQDRKPAKEDKKKETTSISGQVVEHETFEPLSFSNIIVNKQQLVTDVTGAFNFTASADSSFHIRISHLGYYVFDTILHTSINRKFTLIPSTEQLPEVTVQNNLIEKATLIGNSSGNMKLNHTISRFLPGQGDNAVFNLLRLMPGIQAVDEQTPDILIWGSYEGQSLVTFDHFTLFGLKNYHNNISIINPFVVKNIDIYKGGYEARYGNRIGGLVNITGKNGNLQKTGLSFNINPTTINGMAELPLFGKSSLLLAYRQTYYNLYDLDDFNIFAPTRPVRKNEAGRDDPKDLSQRISIYPDQYVFRDFNMKYTFHFNQSNQFSWSFYRGGDDFTVTTNSRLNQPSPPDESLPENPFEFYLSDHETNKQLGFSAFYSMTWPNGDISKLIYSESYFSKKITDYTRSKDLNTGELYHEDMVGIKNEAVEHSIRTDHIVNFTNGHQLEFGGGINTNEALIKNHNNYLDSLLVNSLTNYDNTYGFVFFQDNLNLGHRFSLKSGLRINLACKTKRALAEPRVDASYRLSNDIKVNAAWGRYYQFMYKIGYVDRDKNYTYLWTTGDKNAQTLNATHWITGINYLRNHLTIDLEGYYKTAKNLNRQVLEQRIVDGKMTDGYYAYYGDARIYGIDAYIKKDFGENSCWASYTISKSMERLAPDNSHLPAYRPAPQDQRHEFKVAAIIKVRKLYLSANYIYGSGMEIIKETFRNDPGQTSYKRVDGALTYHFNRAGMSGEIGLSILNIFDRKNLVQNNYKNINIDAEIGSVKIYTDAVPFTPVLFLKLVF
ncbi:TonB-dependent receptor domain-containing protein [Gaoshiqia sp. Z1-71]|uniref:TonB-dependent receptor domain-containing protein n=1 Tax=Gaoshiqia hydrogeniformans TaxID=3290090 RepID=UPI003BF7E525